MGTALTSSGSVVEGVPTLTPPWVPHRGAVRRLGGSGLGGGKTGVGNGDDGGGDCANVERVCSRRGPHPCPTMGTASGCGTTGEGCDGGGDRPYVERVCSRRGPHPCPTMGTASGCGTTGEGFRLGGRKDGCHLVLPVKTGIHGGVTAVGTAPTSSGSVVEGVPTLAPPWVPHRGAVRRLGGSGLGGGKTEGGRE